MKRKRKNKSKAYAMNNPLKAKVKKEVRKIMTNDDKQIRRAKKGRLA